MKTKLDKKYLIISELGQQRRISSQKDLSKNLEISYKDFGLTKNDIILISSNDLENKTNLKENEIKDDYYLFSLDNKYEIYKQEFENKLKAQIENNLYIPNKDLLGDRLSINFINGNNSNKYFNNNIQIQKEISHVKEIYTNFKSHSISINSNFDLMHSLMNKNIVNINKSLSILYNYYKNRIKNIQNNFETLKNNFDEINKRVISNENKIKNFSVIKLGINNKEEQELFKILINENKIKQIKEKINQNLNSVKEKIKNKKKSFEELVNNYNKNINKNFENKIRNVIDEKKLEEIKNEIIKIKEKFNELKNTWNKNKFNEEIKKILEKNEKDNYKINNEDSFDINQRIDKLDDYKKEKEDELIIVLNNIKSIKNESENVLNKIKMLVTDSIIKKFFRFSTDIFCDLNNFESYNKRFISYKNLLENIDKDNFDLLFSLDEALRFRFYFNEYERRINYLKDLKKIICKMKKSLSKENEIRQKFNEELKGYFNGKVNDEQFGISNSILSFFEWDDIKGNFDIYGDKYYTNIKIDEDELNYFISNNKYSPKISTKNHNNININIDNIFSENYFQQEMIYRLNKKIIEYKAEIEQLTNKIEIKNNEFKQLKYNIEQINNIFNSLIQNKQKDKNISEENTGIKKENKIFNPLYDEINDENEEESFAIKDNNDSSLSNEEIKNKNNNENSCNTFLTLEQTFIIKKTFFNYFTNLLSIKNEEYNKLFGMYNSLKMSLEDK